MPSTSLFVTRLGSAARERRNAELGAGVAALSLPQRIAHADRDGGDVVQAKRHKRVPVVMTQTSCGACSTG